jgi:hypothetical protein
MKKGKEGPTANFRVHTMLKKPKPRASLCLAVHGLPWRLVAARCCKAKQRDCDILEAFLQLQMEETDGDKSDT